MLGYFSLDIIDLFAQWEHIMSADYYPSIFLRQMEAIVYISTCTAGWREAL